MAGEEFVQPKLSCGKKYESGRCFYGQYRTSCTWIKFGFGMYVLRFGSSMFGFGKKVQGSGG